MKYYFARYVFIPLVSRISKARGHRNASSYGGLGELNFKINEVVWAMTHCHVCFNPVPPNDQLLNAWAHVRFLPRSTVH